MDNIGIVPPTPQCHRSPRWAQKKFFSKLGKLYNIVNVEEDAGLRVMSESEEWTGISSGTTVMVVDTYTMYDSYKKLNALPDYFSIKNQWSGTTRHDRMLMKLLVGDKIFYLSFSAKNHFTEHGFKFFTEAL